MFDGEIKVTGFKELEELLKQLPARLARNAVARATYAGAVVVRTAAREYVPVRTGKLKKSIRIKKKRSKRGSTEIIYSVGPSLFYGHIVERGVAPHIIRPKNRGVKALGKGGHLGAIVHHPGTSAKPFLRPALDNNTARIIEAMRAKLQAGVEAEGRKR